MSETTNVLIVGVGGQGVLKTSQVLGETLLRAGHDVKQSEVHGMSQRGGSVVSQVRFGPKVHSPLSPHYGADFIIALEEGEGRRAAPRLCDGGVLIDVPPALAGQLELARSRNMAALGRLAMRLDIEPEHWRRAIADCLPEGTIEANIAAFEAGRRFED